MHDCCNLINVRWVNKVIRDSRLFKRNLHFAYLPCAKGISKLGLYSKVYILEKLSCLF